MDEETTGQAQGNLRGGKAGTDVLAGLCPNLDRRALTCARPDHHFTSRMAPGATPWSRRALARSLPNLKVGAGCGAGTGYASLLRGRRSLGRLRQRRRGVRETVEIDEHVRPLALALNPGKGHVGPGNVSARIGDELVEVVDGPVAALRLHCGGIIEPGHRALRATDDTPEIGTHEIGSALGEVVAGRAFLGRVRPFLDAGFWEQLVDRDLRLRRLGGAARLLLRHHDVVARLGQLAWREDGAGGDVDAQHAETCAEDGTEDLVQFEGVHRPGLAREGRREAAAAGGCGGAQIAGLPPRWQPL